MRISASPSVISAMTARTQLGQVMRRATAKNERFVVDRRGEPAVVIMSINDYIDTFAPRPEWLKALQAGHKARGLDRVSMRRIDAEVAAVRDERRSAGRSTKPGK
jgi:prevent-host-death family protein